VSEIHPQPASALSTDLEKVRHFLELDGVNSLYELALNLHWSWNHASDELWQQLSPELWRDTQNPWVILQTLSRVKINATLSDPSFSSRLAAIVAANQASYQADAWFQTHHAASALSCVAYFSMEFMLTEALPIYSGGLGNVAGDQMKAASDLGIPLVGVGLLFGQGYFRQEFGLDGQQQTLYPVNDPGQLPIRPLREANGEWLRLKIRLPESDVWVRCWQATVGRSRLFLLDTNDFANSASHRGITSQLYGGDDEMRLKQEIVLGIGGWRLLRSIGLQPEVCHLNEGHAAFAVLERARYFMADRKCSFEVALRTTRAGNIFTTHTAVPAGFDHYAPELITRYLAHYANDELDMPIHRLLALGRSNQQDTQQRFNMAYLAVRGSAQVNAVSELHGHVSRQIFQPLFERWPQDEIPIGSVTNGIHVPTWDSAGADALWTTACGKKRWHGNAPSADAIRKVDDASLWGMRNQGRGALVEFVRERYRRQMAASGGNADQIFDDNALTIGFARRFATYKRPNLLLHDPERLVRLLANRDLPLQIVLAGKAHPQDLLGQALIRQWNDFIKREDAKRYVVFLSDYDMLMAQKLVQGVDLWLNTPRRPWEASGTSGMKVLANGGLNLSELDGWWAEAYAPEVGWAIGDGREHGNDLAWDSAEAETMYAMLEHEVIAEFFQRQANGLPTRWLTRVRESMARLTPVFSASRAMRQYTEDHYLEAAQRFSARAEIKSALGERLESWCARVSKEWPGLHFDAMKAEQREGKLVLEVRLLNGALKPEDLDVEIYANPVHPGDACCWPMSVVSDVAQGAGGRLYRAEVSGERRAADYTARAVPHHADLFLPLEAPEICWQH
jgi:starch phosphorylase